MTTVLMFAIHSFIHSFKQVWESTSWQVFLKVSEAGHEAKPLLQCSQWGERQHIHKWLSPISDKASAMKEGMEVTMETRSNSRMGISSLQRQQRSTLTLEHSSSQTEGVSGRHKSRSKGREVQLCITGNKEIPRRKVRERGRGRRGPDHTGPCRTDCCTKPRKALGRRYLRGLRGYEIQLQQSKAGSRMQSRS